MSDNLSFMTDSELRAAMDVQRDASIAAQRKLAVLDREFQARANRKRIKPVEIDP